MKITLFLTLMAFGSLSFSQNLTSGLVAHYPVSGNANDASDNGNNGTVNGPLLTTDRFGNQNEAYEFDGVDDYIEVADANSLDLTSLTISLWANHYTAQTSGARYVDKSTAGTGDGYNFDTDGGCYTTGSGVGSRFITNKAICGSSSIPLNEWHHLLVTFENGNTKIYLDGILDGSGTGANTSLSTNNLPLRIGASPLNNTALKAVFFKGKMDQIRIYNRVLNSTEISQVYNEGNPVTALFDSKSKTDLNLKVFPNPATNGVFKLETDNANAESIEINIVNAYGTTVLTKNVVNQASLREEFDLRAYPKGIYFMNVKKGESTSSVKLLNY